MAVERQRVKEQDPKIRRTNFEAVESNFTPNRQNLKHHVVCIAKIQDV